MKDKVKRWRNAHLAVVPKAVIRSIAMRRIMARDFATPGVEYKIASSYRELQQAFDLLEQSYINRGIAEAGHVRMKVLNILPSTTTFIAVRKGEVIGTVSLIEDSELGLPMETVHAAEVDFVRKGHRRLAEVGALALAPSERALRNIDHAFQYAVPLGSAVSAGR